MKRKYRNPQTNVLRIEPSILCASGTYRSGGGSLGSIEEKNGSW